MTTVTETSTQQKIKPQMGTVGLFVTCLIDTVRPSVGFASLNLLEKAGCEVVVPKSQTCCGQPAFNSGDDQGTARIAQQVIESFSSFDYVVVPSGSCAAMIKRHFIEVFADQPEWLEKANALAHKTHELLSFLVDYCHYEPEEIQLPGSFTYHDSCSGLRELNVYKQPRELLSKIEGLKHQPLARSTECCGFGGTFCVKYPDISNAIVGEKVEHILATNAELLLGGDIGCLMNIAGKLNRMGHKQIKVLHTAEVLAGMASELLPDSDQTAMSKKKLR